MVCRQKRRRRRVLLLESTDWIGGQLTSQAVPPDEHRWIGEQGCTASYREYRRQIRSHYRNLPGFSPKIKIKEAFCPADSEVSHLSHPPKLALETLEKMLAPYKADGTLTVLTGVRYLSAEVSGDRICSVACEKDGERFTVTGEMFLDGTDTGELIALCGAEYRTGAESRAETGETHAPEFANPADMQPVTYTAAIETAGPATS